MNNPAKTTRKKPAPVSQKKESNILETDLSQLTVEQLRQLKLKVDEALSPDIPSLKDTDIVLEYSVRIRTSKGIACENVGASRMNSILNLRLLAEAPSRLENEFMQQVYGPINADAFDLFDANNPTLNSIEPVHTHVGPKLDVMPGLPTPVVSPGNGQTLPGE